MKNLLTGLTAVTVLLVCAWAFGWTTCDFESAEGYSTGDINGQPSGDPNPWWSDAVTNVINTTAYSGSQCLEAGPADAAAHSTVGYFADATTDLVKVSFMVNPPSDALSNSLVALRSGGSYLVRAELVGTTGSGGFNITGNTGNQYAGAFSTKLTWLSGAWYKVDIYINLTNDEFAVIIDDMVIDEWYDNGGSLIDTDTWHPLENTASSVNEIQSFGRVDTTGNPLLLDNIVVEEGITELPPTVRPPLYETGFEPENDPSKTNFVLGPLTGQGGWTASDTTSIVQDSEVNSGQQAVRVTHWMDTFSDLITHTFAGIDSQDSIIRVDVNIKPAGFYQSNPTIRIQGSGGKDIVWLEFYDGASRNYGSIKTDGQLDVPMNFHSWKFWRVLCYRWWYSDTWYKLTMDIDLKNQTYDLLIDDQLTNSIDLPFLINTSSGGSDIITNVEKIIIGHRNNTSSTPTFVDDIKFQYIQRPPAGEYVTGFEPEDGFDTALLRTQCGWSGGDTVIVQNQVSRMGSQAIQVGDIYDYFSTAQRAERNISEVDTGYDSGTVYIDFFLKAPKYYTSNPLIEIRDIGGDNSAGYPIDIVVCALELVDGVDGEYGRIEVTDGDTTILSTLNWWNANEWTRYTFVIDLDNKQYDLRVNGDAIDTFTNLGFKSYFGGFYTAEHIRRIHFHTRNGYFDDNDSATPMYIDDFRIGNTPWDPPMPSTEVVITNITYDSAGLTVEWQSTAGKMYSVYWKDNMTDAWTKAADVVATGDPTDWTDTGGAGRTDPRDASVKKRFYLVEEQ